MGWTNLRVFFQNPQKLFKSVHIFPLILQRVALLDPKAIGVGMSVFVAVRTDQHNAEWLSDFAKMVAHMPEVVEFYRMSGEVDYLLRVVVPDMAAYDTFYR